MSEGSINLDIEDGCSEVRRGPWTLEEDNLLIQYISSHGEGRWNSLAISAGLRRTGKSCRLRWLNYLNPHTKRGNLTPHEQLLILDLHSRWGNRWSRIAQHLPGRTDNEIKNYWRSRVQKQARQLKVDSNSKKFLEAIRLYWMPRLLEKMEQDSSSSSSTSQPQSLADSPSPPLQISHPVLPSPVTNSYSLEISELESLGKSFVDHVDILGCGMQELGCEGISTVDVDWFRPAMESSFWNSDELWQFKKLE